MLQSTEQVSMTDHAQFSEQSAYTESFHSRFDPAAQALATVPSRPVQLVVKHIFDAVASLLCILLLSPLLLVVAALIKLTSPGRVIFKHKRAGLHGRVITVYKFRTMVANADQFSTPTTVNGVFAVKDSNDERVTPLGAFLRRSSIDELPQLFNVLRGNMSLVGPRPLSLFEHEKTFRWQARRLQMRPGMTCIWQVSGRNSIMDERRLQMDVDYVEQWSLWLDLKLLLKTIPVVISGKGAR